MTTQDLLFPRSARSPASAEPSIAPAPEPAAGELPFRSAMDKALRPQSQPSPARTNSSQTKGPDQTVADEEAPSNVVCLPEQGRSPEVLTPTGRGTKADSNSSSHESPDGSVEEEPVLTDGETEETAEAVASSNIILFPNPAVIIPFPMALAGGDNVAASMDGPFRAAAGVEPGAAPEEKSGFRNHSEPSAGNIVPLPASSPSNSSSSSEKASSGVDVTKLGLCPVTDPDPAPMTAPSEPSTATPADQESVGAPLTSIISIAFQKVPQPSALADSSDSAESTNALTQLPGATKSAEVSARDAGLVAPDSLMSGQGDASPKVPSTAPLPRVEASFVASAQPTGIPAAKLHSDMNFSSDTRQEPAFRARSEGNLAGFTDSESAMQDELRTINLSDRLISPTEWQTGRAVVTSERLAPESPRADSMVQVESIERISRLVVREAALIRQYHSDSMAVVLRPDAETELYVHLSQRNGQIEAVVRCERGDAQQLGALWPQLQESLAAQKVRLAPLQESPAAQNFQQSSPGPGFGGHGSSRQSPDQQSLDEWPVPASSPRPAQLRDERGSGRRRVTTSRPGWESWA